MVNLCVVMTWLESQSNVDRGCFIWHSPSVCLCVVKAGFLVLSTVRWNLNDEQKHWRLNTMENLATGLVFIIVVANVFITAFGVHRPNRSDWPRKHTGILSFSAKHTLSLFTHSVPAPLFLFKQVFSTLLPYYAVCSYKHPCSQHVFGPLLSWPDLHNPPTWPTNTLPSPGSQGNFEQKTTLFKNRPLFFFLENPPPALLQPWRENREEKRNSCSGKEIWCVNNTTFVPSGQTGRWKQRQSGTCDLTPSVSCTAREWPHALATHRCTTTVTHTTAEQASIFNCTDDVQTRSRGAFFPDSSNQELRLGLLSTCMQSRVIPLLSKLGPTSTALTWPAHLSSTTGVMPNVQL